MRGGQVTLRFLLSCAALVLSPWAAWGDVPKEPRLVATLSVEATPLTLEEVLESVRAHHPKVLVARQGIAQAEGELLAAEGGFDTSWKTRGVATPQGYYEYLRLDSVIEQPTPWWGTRFFAGYRLGVGDIPAYYGEYETLRGGELRAGVEVPLWRDGPIDKRRAELSKARLGREASELSLGSDVLRLQLEAAYAYWDWVVAGRQLAIAEQVLELARVRTRQIALRVERGDLPPLEQTENERSLRAREADTVSARRKLEKATLKLSLYFRNAEGQPELAPESRLPESVPRPAGLQVLEPQSWVEQALRQRPELRALTLQRRMADVDVELAANQRAPAIDVGAAVSRDLGRGPSRLQPTEVQALLKLDIPLQARVATGKRDAAVAKRGAVEARWRYTQEQVIAEVRDALSALRAAAERVELAREATTLAWQLAKAERTSFELGNSSLLLVNLREQMAASAEASEVQALADYQRALADLRAATGATGAGEGAS